MALRLGVGRPPAAGAPVVLTDLSRALLNLDAVPGTVAEDGDQSQRLSVANEWQPTLLGSDLFFGDVGQDGLESAWQDEAFANLVGTAGITPWV